MGSLPLAPTREQRRTAHEAARLRLARLRSHDGPSLRRVFEEAAALTARTIEADRVSVWLFVDDRSALRCCALHEHGRCESVQGPTLHRADYPRYFAALEEQRVIVADDAREDEVTSEMVDGYLVPHDIGSMLDAPIYRGGEVIGVLCHERVGPPRRWSQSDIDFVSSVADTVTLQYEGAARHDAEAALQAHRDYASEVQKMEALGRMAAGVAHDFRNILTVVLGHAALVEGNPATPPVLRLEIEQIRAAAERGVELTRELSAFGRAERVEQPAVSRASAVLAEFAEILRSAVGAGHEIAIDAAGDDGRVPVHPARLERVLLNLVLNARDAMPDGGEIRIRIHEKHLADGDGASGPYVVLEVTDRGVGMDEETRDRLFEPFFTTKPATRGSGLGLAIVYGIVDQAGGFLHVDTAPGEGTTMCVYLPRLADRPAG